MEPSIAQTVVLTQLIDSTFGFASIGDEPKQQRLSVLGEMGHLSLMTDVFWKIIATNVHADDRCSATNPPTPTENNCAVLRWTVAIHLSRCHTSRLSVCTADARGTRQHVEHTPPTVARHNCRRPSDWCSIAGLCTAFPLARAKTLDRRDKKQKQRDETSVQKQRIDWSPGRSTVATTNQHAPFGLLFRFPLLFPSR